MACRCSPSLVALRDQLDRAYPGRSTAADGCCGDARHQREVSDHNPDRNGYAHAYDVTHDPAHGVDCNLLAVSLITDPRVKYVIWNRRIYNPSVTKAWRHYTGSDPHTGHVHLSILPNATHDTRPWPITGAAPPAPEGDAELNDTERATLQQTHDAAARIDAAAQDIKNQLGTITGLLQRLVKKVGA